MSVDTGLGPVKLSELLGVLSFGADLGMGQPMDHVLRQTIIALGLADRIGLTEAEIEAVFFGSLVAWVGCHVDAYEQTKWFGDEAVLKSDFRYTDFSSPSVGARFMLAHLGGDQSLARRAMMIPSFMGDGRTDAEAILVNHWRAAEELMQRVGIEQGVRDTVEQSFERWDGRGVPNGAAGTQINLPARIVNLADVVEIFERAGGVQAAVAVARARAGTQFDPEVVGVFVEMADELFEDIRATEPWDTVFAAAPASGHQLVDENLERALEAVADFVDVKSPWTIGHSRGVAELVDRAAPIYGLDSNETAMLRQAALVHDLGRLGVPNTIWDKAGSLTPSEFERARMHAYLTGRMLASSEALSPLGDIAVQHHERLDGSGYPHGLTGGQISPSGRLLAAADSYHARLEPRPHREAMPPDRATDELRDDVRRGRIDSDAAEAVLATTGQRRPKRREYPGGLTAREVEVLRLLAQGRTNREIASELVISPKTAGSHIEHIYAKLEVNNRSLASLFAAKHGLIAPADPSS